MSVTGSGSPCGPLFLFVSLDMVDSCRFDKIASRLFESCDLITSCLAERQQWLGVSGIGAYKSSRCTLMAELPEVSHVD